MFFVFVSLFKLLWINWKNAIIIKTELIFARADTFCFAFTDSTIISLYFTLKQMGVDYAPFRDLLKSGEWEKADDEHRRLMCVLAGEEAEDREWVYFTEVKNMPVTDLKTIDALWSHFSGGRYGFAIQRKLWVAQKRNWAKFFKKIDWTTGENGDYRKFPNEFLWRADAAPGHMPLTNALRGTQLFEALMEHPAFAPPKTAAEIQAEELAKVQDQVTGAVSRAQGEFGDLMRKGLKGLKKPDWMS